MQDQRKGKIVEQWLGEACLRARKLAVSIRLFLATLAVVLLVAEVFFTANGDLIFMPPKPDQVERAQADLDQLAVAQAIRDLPPDAKIFGCGCLRRKPGDPDGQA